MVDNLLLIALLVVIRKVVDKQMESHKMEKRSVHFRPTGLYPPRLWAPCFCFFWVNMLETQIIVSADHFYLLHVPSWETRPFPFLKGSASTPPHGPPLSTKTDSTMNEHIASAAPVTFYVFSFLNWGMKKQYQLTSVAKTVGLCRAWASYTHQRSERAGQSSSQDS